MSGLALSRVASVGASRCSRDRSHSRPGEPAEVAAGSAL